MGKRPIGPFTPTGGVMGNDKPLVCTCGKDDAFEVRKASLLAVGTPWASPWRRVNQVRCWNCSAIHWYAR